MPTKVEGAAAAMVLAFGLISGACASGRQLSSGTGGSSGSGGATGTGGSSATGAGGNGACANVTACGGSLIGTWTVTSSCLKVSGQLDLTLVGAGCPSAPVTGSLQVTGTWTASANGTYSDDTVTSGDEQFTLAHSCLTISSTKTDCAGAASIIKSLGYSSLTCTDTADGGCNCTAAVHQTGERNGERPHVVDPVAWRVLIISPLHRNHLQAL